MARRRETEGTFILVVCAASELLRDQFRSLMEASESRGEEERTPSPQTLLSASSWFFFPNTCPVFPGGWFPPPASKFQSEKDHLALR